MRFTDAVHWGRVHHCGLCLDSWSWSLLPKAIVQDENYAHRPRTLGGLATDLQGPREHLLCYSINAHQCFLNTAVFLSCTILFHFLMAQHLSQYGLWLLTSERTYSSAALLQCIFVCSENLLGSPTGGIQNFVF